MWYYTFKGLNPTNIEAELDYTVGEAAPSFTTLKYWMVEFKRGITKNHLARKKVVSWRQYTSCQNEWVKFEQFFQTFYSPDLAPLEKCSMVKYLPTMKRRSLRLITILRSSAVVTINRVPKLLNIAEKKVSRLEEKIEKWRYFPQFFYVFFVSSGTSGNTLVLY